MIVRETVQVDPTQAMGMTVPEWPDHPVSFIAAFDGGAWLGHRDGRKARWTWAMKLESGDLLTVYTPEGDR